MTCKFCKTSMARNSDFLKGCKTLKKETLKIHSERQKHKGIVEEYDPAKDLQREKNIELSISKLAYRRRHWTWRLWLNHWKNICFYSFTLYLWLPIFFSLATRILELVASWQLKSHFEACVCYQRACMRHFVNSYDNRRHFLLVIVRY